jgi:hypothetical protein
MQAVVGHWLSQWDDAAERKRGIAMLEALGNRGDAQSHLAEAIRKENPAKAQILLEGALRSYPGHALTPLCEMLLKGEGGAKDERRALALLKGAPSDAQHPRALLGQLILEGRLVPRDPATAIKYLIPWSQWDYDTHLAGDDGQPDCRNQLSGSHPPQRGRGGGSRRAGHDGGGDCAQAFIAQAIRRQSGRLRAGRASGKSGRYGRGETSCRVQIELR